MPAIRSPRQAFPHYMPLATRWMDNDVFGHVNNVQYYSYFDTAVNHYLIKSGWLDLHHGEVVGLVVETKCSYAVSIAFPDELDIGLRVEKLGNSSVRYGIGIFRQGEQLAAAEGYFVHVYVDRKTSTPVRVPAALCRVLQPLLVESGEAP
ncbi:MAG: acyl-CoA thioesterase [Pseudomonadota bacterium]